MFIVLCCFLMLKFKLLRLSQRIKSWKNQNLKISRFSFSEWWYHQTFWRRHDFLNMRPSYFHYLQSKYQTHQVSWVFDNKEKTGFVVIFPLLSKKSFSLHLESSKNSVWDMVNIIIHYAKLFGKTCSATHFLL